MSSKGPQSGAPEQQEAVLSIVEETESAWMRCVRSGGASELHMFIPDVDRKRILCVRKGANWMLPTCLGEYACAIDTRMMMEEVKKILDFEFDGTVLRWIWNRLKDIEVDRCEYVISRALVWFECHEDPEDIPDGWEWVNVHGASIDHPEDEICRAIHQEVVDMRSGRAPKFRVAWGRPGWFRDTSEWMCEILRSHGLEVEGRVEQLKSTALSTVLRARTQKGEYFFEMHACFL